MEFCLYPGVALIAALYAAVGHGGATGYLALMAFLNMPPPVMATTALTLNCLTAGISFYMYRKAGFFSAKLALPFILASIPCAFLGARLPLSEEQYAYLLAGILTLSAIMLFHKTRDIGAEAFTSPPSLPYSFLAGGILGLLSGAAGIGGGVFLSPLIILLKWADTKTTSATAALFIIANSVSGLAGRAFSGQLVYGNLLPFLACAFIGAIVGSRWGARHSTHPRLRAVLGVVLLIAAGKMLMPK